MGQPIPDSDYPPDVLDGGSSGSWDKFRRDVFKNCGRYLRARGAKNMKEIMDEGIKEGLHKRRVGKQREIENLETFFENLKVPISDLKRNNNHD